MLAGYLLEIFMLAGYLLEVFTFLLVYVGNIRLFIYEHFLESFLSMSESGYLRNR